MSRIGLRIVTALLVVSVVPLVFAVLTFRWTVEQTLELGLSPEVEAVLETATAFPRKRGSDATSQPTKKASASKCTAARCFVRFTPRI